MCALSLQIKFYKLEHILFLIYGSPVVNSNLEIFLKSDCVLAMHNRIIFDRVISIVYCIGLKRYLQYFSNSNSLEFVNSDTLSAFSVNILMLHIIMAAILDFGRNIGASDCLHLLYGKEGY